MDRMNASLKLTWELAMPRIPYRDLSTTTEAVRKLVGNTPVNAHPPTPRELRASFLVS
jgi:hypothetical protein